MGFDTEKHLDSLNMFGIRLGLDATFELIARAGNPDKNLKFIHLAGTNGKGSTSAMLERACRAWGLRTGLYTSPHLVNVRERFRINGKLVPLERFNRAGAELAAAARSGNFSYFEFATVLAMKIFAEAKCDIVIWETGMGGRLDATNTVSPLLTIITNIALDHQHHLGSTTAAIASEKAGILKPGVPLIHGKLPADAKEVIYRKAAESAVPVFPPRAEVPDLRSITESGSGFIQHFNYDGHDVALALPGKMQRENFRIVYEALLLLAREFGQELSPALAAMAQVKWPARLQKLDPQTFLDGGHNPDGVAALAASLNELCPGEKFTVIYTAFADKEADKCLPILASFAGSFIFTSLDTEGREVFDAAKLTALAAQYHIPATVENSPLAALEQAKKSDRRILISGSLYLAGTILEHYFPDGGCFD